MWLATDPALGREVAVKVLSARLTDDATAQRFRRECMALGAVSGHPNIVTVHAVGATEAGLAHLVMGYESGGSLGDRLDVGPVPWPEVLDIGIRMADALEVAHRAGVLHRDVKPDNILVGAFGDPKLTDFGIARLTGGPHTTSGRITASVVHAPPEVLGGQSPDVQGDVYSLCSTMFTLIAGSTPFERDTDESLLPLIARIVSQPPPPLPQGTPEMLTAVLRRGLSKSADERQPTAAALAAELRAVAHSTGLPVPPSRTGIAAAPVAERAAGAPPASPAPASPPPASRPPASRPPQADLANAPLATPPGPAGASRRGAVALVGALALALGLIGAGVWALVAADDGSAPTPSVAPDDPTATDAPASDAPTPDALATATTAPATTTDALETPTPDALDAPTTDTPGAGGAAEGITAADLEPALLTTADLPGGVTLLDQIRAEDVTDATHPILDYGYCDVDLPLLGVGAGTGDVFSSGLLDLSLSSVMVTESDARARDLVTQISMAAGSCEQYEVEGGTTIEILEITELDGGVVRLDLQITVLGQGVPTIVYLASSGPLVLTLELPQSVDQAAPDLVALAIERAAALATTL